MPIGALPQGIPGEARARKRRDGGIGFGKADAEHHDEDARQRHEEDEADLHPAQDILDPDAGFEEATMHDGDGGEEAEGNGFLAEFGAVDSQGEEHVFAEDDAVACGEAEEHCLDGYEGAGEEAGPWICEFEVDFLASGSGQHAAVLEGDLEAEPCEEGAGDPEEESQADAAGRLEDGSGGGEDSGPNDSGDDEDVGAGPGEIAA
ncbi:hypothetical protein EYC84_001395 [Monilinia fructicola]|uniref:Uncharacterized protein n=1 Tax=Monilinia fructicola TaxID=38448 RepID=A0A5M9JUE7_MONFR|nr:hypothetical protein EYC84_001395 [Monilinia fructicola]